MFMRTCASRAEREAEGGGEARSRGPGGAGEQVTDRKSVITWRCLASHCIRQQRLILAGDMIVSDVVTDASTPET